MGEGLGERVSGAALGLSNSKPRHRYGVAAIGSEAESLPLLTTVTPKPRSRRSIGRDGAMLRRERGANYGVGVIRRRALTYE